MTTPTPAQLRALELDSQDLYPGIPRPTSFLSLAPTTSASYPRQQPTSPPRSTTSSPEEEKEEAGKKALDTLGAVHAPPVAGVPVTVVSENAVGGSGADVIAAALKERRSSSTTSSGSDGSAKTRFLKLGPVHWGEHHGDDGKGDWAE